jgi:hypothetical protein
MRSSPYQHPDSRMLSNSHDLQVTHGTASHFGFYEISADKKVLARRVDIPDWACSEARNNTSLLAKIQHKQIEPPKGARCQGHIFWRPIEIGFEVPGVGVDRSIFDQVIREGPVIKTIFVIFAENKISERWRIVTPVFKTFGRCVQPLQIFEPQIMVPVTNVVLEPSS